MFPGGCGIIILLSTDAFSPEETYRLQWLQGNQNCYQCSAPCCSKPGTWHPGKEASTCKHHILALPSMISWLDSMVVGLPDVPLVRISDLKTKVLAQVDVSGVASISLWPAAIPWRPLVLSHAEVCMYFSLSLCLGLATTCRSCPT